MFVRGVGYRLVDLRGMSRFRRGTLLCLWLLWLCPARIDTNKSSALCRHNVQHLSVLTIIRKTVIVSLNNIHWLVVPIEAQYPACDTNSIYIYIYITSIAIVFKGQIREIWSKGRYLKYIGLCISYERKIRYYIWEEPEVHCKINVTFEVSQEHL
jgi:hypothetical protein